VSDKNAAAPGKEKASSKKLIVIGAIVAVLVVGAGAAWFVLGQKAAQGEQGGGASAKAAVKAPPTFLPMENMVVNLADPGGDRFAQIGITLELDEAKTADQIKLYLPSIRSSILVLVSQRTADELLTREGKEKLSTDILREVLKPLGYKLPKNRKAVQEDPPPEDEDEEDAPRRPKPLPVRQVLFSSFIIQ
jgi:flagellar protein FliL